MIFDDDEDHSKPLTPEEILWIKVIETAVDDLAGVRGGEQKTRANANTFGAKLWFQSARVEPGSFLWICDHIDIDAGEMLKNLKLKGLLK